MVRQSRRSRCARLIRSRRRRRRLARRARRRRRRRRKRRRRGGRGGGGQEEGGAHGPGGRIRGRRRRRRRGAFEGELMAGASKPLEANKVKVRGAGGGGGFGGGGGSKSGKMSASALKAEGKSHAKVLKRDGVVRIDSVLSPELADAMREYAYDLRKASEDEVAAGKVSPIQRFADVLLRKDRCDLTIPLGTAPIIADALSDVLRGSAAGYAIESILGKDAVLYELSCLMSDPGSQRQVMHPDTPFLEGQGPVLYTCFIALQDVKPDMGPTTWIPGTHTADAHATFQDGGKLGDEGESPKDRLLRTSPAVLGTLTKGSCAIFDSRTLHCGGANGSETSRALFYFSFKNPKVGYPGNPASIRSELGRAAVTLEALRGELDLHTKGKETPLMDRLAEGYR